VYGLLCTERRLFPREVDDVLFSDWRDLSECWAVAPPTSILVAGALGFTPQARSKPRDRTSMGELAARFGGKVMPGGRCG
jgi:hypothetical protein